MNERYTISLQNKLVKSSVWSSVFAGLVAFILLLGISSYQTMSLNDEIMDEITDMLLITDLTNTSGQQVDELSEEFEIQYKFMLNNRVLTASQDFPIQDDFYQIKHLKKGYSYVWYDHRIWRTYMNYEDDPNFFVVSIQPLDFRFQELWRTVILYLLALFVLWFLQWTFVSFAIQKQFKSIHLLSNKISKRNASNLDPIVQKPVEIIELQPIVSQVNELLSRLKVSMLAEQRFTADASHELRSPLSAIQMRLQVLQRKYGQHQDFQHHIKQIQTDVNRSKHILENLLLLARLDPTEINKLPQNSFNIYLMIQDVLHSLQPFIDEKNIQYNVEEKTFYMMANQELIYTCVRNLIDNAIRYGKFSGHIYISLTETAFSHQIIIEDSGEQLTDEVLDHLGERFYRALGTKTQGSGLGLSICKKVIQLHGGSIVFKRSEYGGLKAILSIPK